MITEVQKLFDAITALPESEQDRVARNLLDELKWDTLFNDPRSEQFFEQMVREIDAERKNGTLTDLETCMNRNHVMTLNA